MNVIRLQPDCVSSATKDKAPESSADTRFESEGLDLLRALAAMAVVLLHACVPYLKHPMPGLIWPVSDGSSQIADITFWAIEVIIMPVFLVLAGFFLWRSAQHAKPAKLFHRRAKRLLVPLAFGCLFVLPADLYIWTLGLVSEGIVPAVKLKSLKFDGLVADQIWGLSHLWFLLYVFLYVAVITFAMQQGWISARRSSEPSSSGRKKMLFALLAVAAGSLLAAPEVVWGFQHAYLPVPSKWIYSGAFFAIGWWLASGDPDLRRTSEIGVKQLAYGLVILGVAVAMGRWFIAQNDLFVPVLFVPKLFLSVSTVTAATGISFCAIGMAAGQGNAFLSAAHPLVRNAIGYFAGASLWVYLVHHPFLGLIHLGLKWGLPEVPPLAKLLLAFVISCGLCLATFEIVVRRTWLGGLLGMSRPRVSLAMQAQTDTMQAQTEARPVVTVEHDFSDGSQLDERKAA